MYPGIFASKGWGAERPAYPKPKPEPVLELEPEPEPEGTQEAKRGGVGRWAAMAGARAGVLTPTALWPTPKST